MNLVDWSKIDLEWEWAARDHRGIHLFESEPYWWKGCDSCYFVSDWGMEMRYDQSSPGTPKVEKRPTVGDPT